MSLDLYIVTLKERSSDKVFVTKPKQKKNDIIFHQLPVQSFAMWAHSQGLSGVVRCWALDLDYESILSSKAQCWAVDMETRGTTELNKHPMIANEPNPPPNGLEEENRDRTREGSRHLGFH